MFYPECARLAGRHPDLADSVQQIDAQLKNMGSVGLLRPADLAGFLRIDQNQVRSILEGLATDKVLTREVMIECLHCGAVVPRSIYDEVLEQEDEYFCSCCDSLLTGRTSHVLAAYRSGENWTTAEPQRPIVDETNLISNPEPEEQLFVFQNQGRTWRVAFEGQPKSVKDMVGMEYLCHLLQTPYKDLHCAEIRGVVSGIEENYILGSAGEMSDHQKLREYRDRLAEIETELERAQKNHDFGLQDSLALEWEQLTEELKSAKGIGGKLREAGDDRKRAIDSVNRAVKRALVEIREAHEPLWKHLNSTVKTGAFLSYQPDVERLWEF